MQRSGRSLQKSKSEIYKVRVNKGIALYFFVYLDYTIVVSIKINTYY